MRKKLIKILIYIALPLLISEGVLAESLFQLGVAQSVYPSQPKSLFNTIRAKTIGDVITVIINENALVVNDLQLNVKNSSSMEDKFSTALNNFSKKKYIPNIEFPNLDDFGGSSQTKNTANIQKSLKFKDIMTTQVVQVLPNGNLVIQGKKVAINSGEKTQVILSGIVDPRFITNAGSVESHYIVNLQLAIVGNGTVSRHDNESVINRIFNNFF